MKRFISLFVGSAVLIAACVSTLTFTGCALFDKNATPADKQSDVEELAYQAASLGATAALTQNPEWRTPFGVVYAELNQQVESGTLTPLSFPLILNKLPVKELKSPVATLLISDTIRLVKKYATGATTQEEINAYYLAAGRGVRDGLKVALGL